MGRMAVPTVPIAEPLRVGGGSYFDHIQGGGMRSRGVRLRAFFAVSCALVFMWCVLPSSAQNSATDLAPKALAILEGNCGNSGCPRWVDRVTWRRGSDYRRNSCVLSSAIEEVEMGICGTSDRYLDERRERT